jgi:hypothetical protein
MTFLRGVLIGLSFVLVVALIASASARAARVEVGARLTHQNRASLPPSGRAGDAESAAWTIRDRHGRPIGDMLLDCRWVTTGLRLCVGQVSMPLGALSVIGASATRFIGQLSVVGGTGPYLGAAGVLTFNAIGSNRYVLSINYRQEGGNP